MVKINTLELENVKRIKAVALAPAANGLTVIGGDNNQGKTSVLDAIAWALGGDRFKPTGAKREGSVIPPHLKITLSNGLIVERSGNNSTLKVIDPNGNKGGQALLNSFIEQLALDLPKFLGQTAKEKAETLLKIIGVGEQLHTLDREEEQLYNQRHAIGVIADRKDKYAKEMPEYPDTPDSPVSVSELIGRQQAILARNGENQRKREQAERFTVEYNNALAAFAKAEKELETAKENLEIARKSAENLQDESTAELEADIANIEKINIMVRANMEREKALQEAQDLHGEYNTLTDRIEKVRKTRTELLDNAEMPLEGLSVDKGELIYNGAKWDCMSGSEQLRVATAIIRKLNPECGFVLIDKLEQMDGTTLSEFGAWLESEGLQAIATRVSTGDECSVIIEDGYSITPMKQPQEITTKWKAGTF